MLVSTGSRDNAAKPLRVDDANLVEISPVSRYESDRSTIKGSFKAPVPGIYVLYFDNSFSIKTPKRLLLWTSVDESSKLREIHAL